MSIPHAELPTVAELRRLVKKRERERFSAMWFLEPIQVYFSYALIRLRMNSIQVTVLWLLVAFAGYGVIAWGTPAAFIGGALLLYLKTILDGVDGEVARFHKQFVSAQEDLESFIDGIYLDKVFHIIEKPFWGLSLGFGLYRMSGDWWVFAAGVSLAIFHGFCRHNNAVMLGLPAKFQPLVQKLHAAGEISPPPTPDPTDDSVPVRVMDRLDLWIKNGKRLNLLLFLAACTDLTLSFTPWAAARGATYFLVCAVGVVCPFLLAFVIVRTVRSRKILLRALALGGVEQTSDHPV